MANFDKIAFYFDNQLIQFFYRRAHQQCLNFIKDYLKENIRILEIGCGTGNFLKQLEKANKNFQLFGLDESQQMIEIAQRKFKEINFQVGSADNLPFENNYFDFITVIDAFYYFQDKEKVLLECARVLKEDGVLFIYTPSIDQPISKFLCWLSKWSSLEKRSKHLYFDECNLLAKKFNFQIIKRKIACWPFLPFFNYWFIIWQKATKKIKKKSEKYINNKN